nr:probable leucine-rich repeat receptor-like serine/threonine-protein kinase At3g14840 [Tanacetum cinerariifolium]
MDVSNMLFIVLCVTLLPFGFASINTTRLPTEEVDALRVIGRKLGKRDWNFGEDPCVGWRNSNDTDTVACCCNRDSMICHVVNISLKGQSLPGTLPPEFADLPYLQNIDLTRNFLNGTIPPDWGSMQRLVNISLLGNRLTGSIPKELGNISTLKSLTVEDNMMSGIIPEELGSLASMERLFLNGNNFTGELPASFANLNALKEFRISGNSISGKIPEFIGKWNNLDSLRIQASGLEGPIPSNITLLPTLTDLRISDLNGPDTLCPPFINTTSFKHLILRSCNLIGNLPESLSASKVLDLSFNKLHGSIPESYINIKETEYIYLTGNMLSGSVPKWMLEEGDTIDLSYNKFNVSPGDSCQIRTTNLFASFSTDNISKNAVSCLGNIHCPIISVGKAWNMVKIINDLTTYQMKGYRISLEIV